MIMIYARIYSTSTNTGMSLLLPYVTNQKMKALFVCVTSNEIGIPSISYIMTYDKSWFQYIVDFTGGCFSYEHQYESKFDVPSPPCDSPQTKRSKRLISRLLRAVPIKRNRGNRRGFCVVFLSLFKEREACCKSQTR